MPNISKQNTENKIKSSKAGFTLFVSMIVASLLLAVGFSIGNIILKQLILSGSGKDSQIAFYAADSGAECAQLWDGKDKSGANLLDSPFDPKAPPFSPFPDPNNDSIRCGSGVVYATKECDSAGCGSTEVKFSTSTLIIDYTGNVISTGGSSKEYRACAKVLVIKGVETIVGEEIPYTKIMSRGYNSKRASDGSFCETSNPRIVERGVFVQY